MSDFASLLDTFKKNAATELKSSSSSSSSSSSMYKTTSQTTNTFERKRPHPNNSKRNIVIPPPPSFPSFHHNIRKSKEEASFELSFLIIGAQKAGTTWLHTLLHKCSHLALPHSTKEVHFWDWHHRNGFDWYVQQFVHPRKHYRQQHSSKRWMGSNTMMTSKTKLEGGDKNKDNNINNDVIDVSNDELLYGEVTPCYIVLPVATIAEIHKCFPNVKLIFIARNLVDRAWSAMVMELRDQSLGMKPGEFANGVFNDDATSEREGEGGSGAKKTKNECNSTSSSMAQQWRIQQQSSPMAQADTYFLERLCSETHTSRSDYAKHLRYWYSIFPPESILLLNYDEISIDPRNVLHKVVSHIGLSNNDASAYVASLSDEDVRQRVNAAAAATSADQMMNTNSRSDDPSEIISTTDTLSMRPTLKQKMQTYLLPFTKDFNALLVEHGYTTWKI